MPILITKELLNASKTAECGWSLATLSSYEERPNRKNSDYNDYIFNFECIAGPGNSKENSGRLVRKTLAGQGMGFEENVNFLTQLFHALSGQKIEDLIGQEVDFTKLVGKQAWLEIKDKVISTGPSAGKMFKDIATVAPPDVVPF